MNEYEADVSQGLHRDYFTRCFGELFTNHDPLIIVLRGHLYCESALRRILRHGMKHPAHLELDRYGYADILHLCGALGLVMDECIAMLRKLNEYRNAYAHRLDFVFSERDQQDLLNTLRTHLSHDHVYEVVNQYISLERPFPIPTQRTVLAVWFLLELHYLLLEHGLASGIRVTELLHLPDVALPDAVHGELRDAKDFIDRMYPLTMRQLAHGKWRGEELSDCRE